MLKKLSFVILIIALLAGSICSQTTGKVSLIVGYMASQKKDYLTKIERFDFLDGKLIRRKEILSYDDDKAGGISWLAFDRYILTSNQTINEWRPKDEITFDLKTEQFVDRKIIPQDEEIDFETYEIKSPDGNKGIKFNGLREGVERLTIHRKGQEDLVINESFAATVASKSSILPDLPIKWIDNESLLTQKQNGSLVIVTLDGKVTPFLEIPCTSDDFPSFKITKAGKLIYKCSATEYLINVEGKTFTRIKNDLDYDFSYEYSNKKQEYYYKDKPIGGEGVDVSTTEDYLATTYGKPGNYGFFDSSDMNIVNVWNQFTRKWQTFKVDGSHIEILGWYR